MLLDELPAGRISREKAHIGRSSRQLSGMGGWHGSIGWAHEVAALHAVKMQSHRVFQRPLPRGMPQGRDMDEDGNTTARGTT